MSNTARELKKRLFHLFPAKHLKEHFQKKGSVDDILEEISVSTPTITFSFAYDYRNYTRQNIYLYTLNKNFVRVDVEDDFPFSIEKEIVVNGETILCCFPKTVFKVYLDNPVEKEDLIFLQPVFIRVKGKRLIIQLTKLEKAVNSYYEIERDAKKASVSNGQEDITKSILTYLSGKYTVNPTDFNMGLKAIWHSNDIDCHKVQSRDSDSVIVETMDGEKTFKEKYPAKYAAVVLTPLASGQWKYLKDDEYLCDGFTADPGTGLISITKFPKHPNQVDNVIDKILAGN